MSGTRIPALQATTDAFLTRFAGLRERLPGDPARREQAASVLRALGLPGPRDEAWRYTLLRPLNEVAFHEPLVLLDDCAGLMARLPAIDAPRLVFVDGRFRAELSVLPDAVSVTLGEPSLRARPEQDRVAALNTLLTEDGATIAVPAGIDGGALQLISLASAEEGRAIAFHPSHSVTLGEGAALTLIEIGLGDGVYLHNPVLTVSVERAATLTHLRLQGESPQAFVLSTVYADVAADASYDSFQLTLGARLSRAEIHARLGGPNAVAHLNAARLIGGSQHADFTTVVSHDAPGCASRQTVKTVLTGRARGVFQGKIEVARVAQKTDGYQMNQALLLSPDCEMDSKPQLEIYADDVKCSHGATVGALDAEQLFYLRSRGVPAAEARAMLVRAFLDEAIAGVAHDGARAAMDAAITAWWERQG